MFNQSHQYTELFTNMSQNGTTNIYQSRITILSMFCLQLVSSSETVMLSIYNSPSMNTNLPRHGISPGVDEEANGENGTPAVV